MTDLLKINVKSLDITKTDSDCIVVLYFEDCKLSPEARALDKASGGALRQHLKTEQAQGKAEELFCLTAPKGIKAKRILLAGAGDPKALDARALKKLILAIGSFVSKLAGTHAHICLDALTNKQLKAPWVVQYSTQWLTNQSYRFKQYKSESESKSAPKHIKTLTIVNEKNTRQLQQAAKIGISIATGMAMTRDLGNLPGNVCHPSYLVTQARKLANRFPKLSCKVIDEKELEKMGAGAFCAVAKGSKQSGKLICLHYQGAKNKKDAPYTFVGKGITFDSGGISLKPGAGMEEMKFDMCGAATVMGLMQIVSELALPINVVGAIAAAENMPSGEATRPGDIITTLCGKTVEIINTDAEGRLVLCDTLTYIGRYKPKVVIDIATLTGACIIALGHHHSGLMANNEPLAQALVSAGQESTDYAWQLPLTEEHTKQLENNFADLSNIGGRSAGTITAGAFLAEFTKDYDWAHLDIAGTAWVSGNKNHGATGRPVPLLAAYLLQEAGV